MLTFDSGFHTDYFHPEKGFDRCLHHRKIWWQDFSSLEDRHVTFLEICRILEIRKKKVSKNHSRDSHKKEEKIGETKCEHTDQI